MKKNTLSLRVAGLAVVAVVGLAGCTSTPAAPAAEPTPSEVPAHEDNMPPAPEDVTEIHGLRAEVFDSIHSLAAASEHIVIAQVVKQKGQPPNYDLLPMSESTIRVLTVLKGDWRTDKKQTVFDVGSGDVLMNNTAAPMTEGTTYLLFLVPMGNWDMRNGNSVNGRDIYTSTIPAHFYVSGDTFTLDEPAIPDPIPRTFTLAELQAALQ